MAHVSEERDMPVPPAVIWRIVTDTQRWPQFFATPKETLHLRSVELLEDPRVDTQGAKRRLSFLGVPSWDEQVSAWRENEYVSWLGIRNPGLKYWQQQMELIPGRTPEGKPYTTLRWDIYYSLGGPHPLKKVFRKTMESIMISSLERIERMALAEDAMRTRIG